MKTGYIVWNCSNCDCEFFGVYRNFEDALRQFRKVVKNRFGECPRSYEDILQLLVEKEDGDDSLRITPFSEHED